MKKVIRTTILALGVIFLQLTAQAQQEVFVANLSSAQEVPTNGSNGTGVATARLDAIASQLIITVAFNGLTSNQTAGGIHGLAQVGLNAGMVFNLGATGTQNGTLTGVYALTTAQVQALRSHQMYINLATVNFPNGEIRGQLKPANQPVDFDGDGRSDIGVFRPANGFWYHDLSLSGAFASRHWGAAGDVITPGDFDSDGKTDHAIWRSGIFYVFRSQSQTLQIQPWGASGDDPRVVGDWDGDGRADFTVYREGTPAMPQSYFYIRQSSDGMLRSILWGAMGDAGLMGDWDGDGNVDAAVYRRATGTFYVQHSSTGLPVVQPWGNFAQDTVAPADYDGDGKTDFAIFRDSGPGAGAWHILGSTAGYINSPFGIANDTAVPADYDGDGKADLAVFRGAGNWFINASTAGFNAVAFGAATDDPLSKYLTR